MNCTKVNAPLCLGVDLALRSFQAALCPKGFPLARWRELPTVSIPHGPDTPEGMEQLERWLREQAPQGVEAAVAESTGQLARRFARALEGRGLPQVAIINPLRSKAFAVSVGARDKSDRIDAQILALFGAVHEPEATPLRCAGEESLRQRSRLRECYVRDLGAWENRLGEALDGEERQSIERMIESIKEEIGRMDEAMERAIEESEALSAQVRDLKQIKGIGDVVARTLTAEMGLLAEYGREQLVAAAGLFPKSFESGTSVSKKPRLAKGGGGRIRRVLYLAATSLFRSKGAMRRYIEGMRARGLCDMVIAGAVMRKLLLVARAVVCSGGVYDDAKICSC